MIVAFLIIASRVWMRPSTNACSFLASSYSAFSDRSPCSLASWIRCAISGRRTASISSSSARSLSRPSLLMYVVLVFTRVGPPRCGSARAAPAARSAWNKRTPGGPAAAPPRFVDRRNGIGGGPKRQRRGALRVLQVPVRWLARPGAVAGSRGPARRRRTRSTRPGPGGGDGRGLLGQALEAAPCAAQRAPVRERDEDGVVARDRA